MLTFCVNSSPAFLYTGIGISLFHSATVGCIFLASSLFACLITGAVSRIGRLLSGGRQHSIQCESENISFCNALFRCEKRRAVHGADLRICCPLFRLHASFLCFSFSLSAAGGRSLYLRTFRGLYRLRLAFLLRISKSDGCGNAVFLFRRRLRFFTNWRDASWQRRFHAPVTALARLLQCCGNRSDCFFEPSSFVGYSFGVFCLFRYTACAFFRLSRSGLCALMLHDLAIVFFCASCYNKNKRKVIVWQTQTRGGIKMKQKLFGKNIEPACGYCENGKLTADGLNVLCKRKGVCAPYDSCSKFVYAPLKRIPKRAPQLLTYEKEDFSL